MTRVVEMIAKGHYNFEAWKRRESDFGPVGAVVLIGERGIFCDTCTCLRMTLDDHMMRGGGLPATH